VAAAAVVVDAPAAVALLAGVRVPKVVLRVMRGLALVNLRLVQNPASLRRNPACIRLMPRNSAATKPAVVARAAPVVSAAKPVAADNAATVKPWRGFRAAQNQVFWQDRNARVVRRPCVFVCA